MNFMKRFSKRLNINICPDTYKRIEQEAISEGRKTGNMTRIILDEWAMNRKILQSDKRGKNMEH